MKFDFKQLRQHAASAGARVRDCGGGHWQVIGDYLVNFYPHAGRGPTYYIAGTSSAQPNHPAQLSTECG